jgi:hypothetical protein
MKVWQYQPKTKDRTDGWSYMYKIEKDGKRTEMRRGQLIKEPYGCPTEKVVYERILD